LFHQRGDGFNPRRVNQAQRFRRRRARLRRRRRFGHFQVGRVVAAGAEYDGVLAGVGQHMKLMRGVAADTAGVGHHRAVVQAHAVENRAIGLPHHFIGLAQRRAVDAEGVGVFHDELAPAHDAEARADFVAELGLDLVEIGRQLTVTAQFVFQQRGDDFLVRRPDAKRALVAVGEAQQLRPVFLPPPRLAPQLGRLHRRHQHLLRAGTVHLFANDALHLAQYIDTGGQPVVDSRGHLADEAGAQHQLVADDFGVGGDFL